MNLDFSDIKVLLIGDFMIDHYIFGTSTRMSPEAPVPVIIPEKEYSIPGGAGNVAMNLAALGADITCLGCVGNDIWGKSLLSILENKGIKTEKIEIIDNYPTTLKQRIYLDDKQVTRLDTEKIINWKLDDIDTRNLVKKYDIMILSDYNKGVLNFESFLINIERSYESRLKHIIVDPRKDDFSYYTGANIITPNLNELAKATTIKIPSNQSIVAACKHLSGNLTFEYIVAKKGDKGMIVVGKDNFIKHIDAHFVSTPDVTGAGDTVISALSLAYAQTNDIEFACNIANAAAAIAVRKPGTNTVTIKEIKELLAK